MSKKSVTQSKISRGRPSSLTTEVKLKLIESLKLGMSYKDCCTLSGITYSTFQNWINKGESEKSGEFFDFFVDIKKAQAEGKKENIQTVKDDKTWQSKAWLLERQHPREFGNKLDVTTDGEKINEINIVIKGSKSNLTKMIPEEKE